MCTYIKSLVLIVCVFGGLVGGFLVYVCICLGCIGLSGFVLVCGSNMCDLRHFGARVGVSCRHYISEGFERT